MTLRNAPVGSMTLKDSRKSWKKSFSGSELQLWVVSTCYHNEPVEGSRYVMAQAVHATHLYTVIKGLTPKVKLSLHTWITAAPALHRSQISAGNLQRKPCHLTHVGVACDFNGPSCTATDKESSVAHFLSMLGTTHTCHILKHGDASHREVPISRRNYAI
jgi:hypothetical protein